jgi:hypothetical protein
MSKSKIHDDNLHASDLSQRGWNETDAPDSILKLWETVYAKSDEASKWYLRRKEGRKNWAYWSRFLAVVFFTFGIMFPTLLAAGIIDTNSQFSNLGYLSMAIAGAVLAIDRYSCVSSGWILYVKAALRIQKFQEEFQLQWEQLRAKCKDDFSNENNVEQAFVLIRDFQRTLHSIIENETNSFFADFEKTHVELSTNIQTTTLRGSRTPGTVK